LDVMIDSNDVNDSDSNSNQNAQHARRSRFDSTSQDDDTLMNDDSTITDDTSIDKISSSGNGDKVTSSPRTRSRGTVKINLWTLDDSPILPAKRHKVGPLKTPELSREERQLRADFGLKECKVSVIDIQSKQTPPPLPSSLDKIPKPLPKTKVQRKLNAMSPKNNHTLDSWLQKTPEPLNKHSTLSIDTPATDKDDVDDKIPAVRTRRNAVTLSNKTL